jgi:hypothetical protein
MTLQEMLHETDIVSVAPSGIFLHTRPPPPLNVAQSLEEVPKQQI